MCYFLVRQVTSNWMDALVNAPAMTVTILYFIYSKGGQRALDELQRTIIEIETKYKSELSRLKKKYDAEIREYEIQIETLNRANGELARNNKGLAGKVKVRVTSRWGTLVKGTAKLVLE